MKPTQRKDAIRNIRKRIVSYLSVGLVIMLGLGGFFTTSYMCEGLGAEASKFYADRDFEDFEIIESLGASEATVSKIVAEDGVIAAEGVMQSDGMLTTDSVKQNVTVMTLTEKVSVPEVTDGRLPSGQSECIIGEDLAETAGIVIGDKVGLSLTGLNMDDPLIKHEYTVTGLMRHPNFIRRKNIMAVCLPEEAFDSEITGGLYTRVFVRIEQPEGVDILSDEYFDQTADIRHRLEELTDELAADRAQEMKDEANAKIDEEWEKALAELTNAENEIEANEDKLYAKLADSLRQLKEAEKDLASERARALQEIRNAEALISAGEKRLRNGWAEYRSKKKQLDEAVAKYKSLYGNDIESDIESMNQLKDMLDRADTLFADYDETQELTPEQTEFVTDLAGWMTAHGDMLKRVYEFGGKEEVINLSKELAEKTEIDISDGFDPFLDLGEEELARLVQVISDGDILPDLYSTLSGKIDSILKMVKKLRDAQAQLAAAKKELEAGDRELAASKKELEAGKKELAEETAKARKKIKAGWNEYYSQKNKYESKLDEARALLAVNREEAEAKLREAKAEVDKIECSGILLDRRTNYSYMDLRDVLKSVNTTGLLFGLLFFIITAVVCFSTLTIIIEEQKQLVGTSKAFGFFKREVLGKYMVFGCSAAVTGCILGIASGIGLSSFAQAKFHDTGVYSFNQARSIITPGPTLIACAGMICVCILATIISCTDILKSPASVLMKGGSRKDNGNRRKASSKRGGSLYSRLIIRNMLDDKARVAVSIAVIAFSCLLIGTGISMKISFDKMPEKQLSDVFRYDLRVDMSDDVTDEQEKALCSILEKDDVSYMPAAYEAHLFRRGDMLDVLYVLCADTEVINDYVSVMADNHGTPAVIPEDGVLVQHRMDEAYGMSEGDSLTLIDSSLKEHETEIKGTFYNYAGKIIVTSPSGYKSIFGTDHEANCLYVNLDGKDAGKIRGDLLEVTDNISFSDADEFRSIFDSVSAIYNIIVLLMTGMAILISFMILANLANIFINRKKTELIVMRVNGFSVGQTIGYLAREAVITAAAGIILGVIAGALVAPIIIRSMMASDVQFYNVIHVNAWLIAAGLEALFALVVDATVFRKVKDLNLRDIA